MGATERIRQLETELSWQQRNRYADADRIDNLECELASLERELADQTSTNASLVEEIDDLYKDYLAREECAITLSDFYHAVADNFPSVFQTVIQKGMF